MTYYDYNGKITIDETAAKNDIHKIQAALAKLESSRVSMDELMQQSIAIEGQTGRAVEAKSREMIQKLDRLIRNLNQEITAINQTVAKYKRLDQKVKAAIQRN